MIASASNRDLYGCDEPPEPAQPLSAGRYSFLLERGHVRAFARDGAELIRGVAFVVRDTDWNTLPLVPRDLRVTADGGRVEVRYRACVQIAEGALEIAVQIALDADGRLRFDACASAQGDVLTNRTGLVVLYPLRTAAGAPVEVEHSDGSVEATAFPRRVAPGQPALDIRGLRHDPLPGLTMTLRFEGEVFEMEDHRNWTDAAFKVYSRPLAWPRPYGIRSGDEMRQAVDVRIVGKPLAAAAPAVDRVVRMTIGAAAGLVPGFGIAAQPQDARLPDAVLARYASVPPHHLVCAVGRIAGPAAMRSHAELVRRLGFAGPLTLEAVVSGDDPEGELQALATEARREGLTVAAISVFMEPFLRSYQPTDAWPETAGFERLHRVARRAFPAALIGGGMYTFFTELNRRRDAVRGADYVTHTTCPLVHDCDDRSVMQTLEALPDVFATTRDFAGAAPYRLGPIALGLRLNPGGAPVAPNPERRRSVLTDDDPRWRGRFGAAWIAGYAAEASKAGLDTVAFGALGGPSALVAGAGDPDRAEGAPYPVYRAFAALAAASRRPYLPVLLAHPDLRGLGWLDRNGRRQALVANTGPECLTVSRDSAMSGAFRVEDLAGEGSPTSAAAGAGGTIELGPYAVMALSETNSG